MGADEFVEWQIEYARNPWGPERADLRMGILDAMVANIGKSKGERLATAEDFLLMERPRPKQDWRTMKAILADYTRKIGGAVIDG